MNYRDTCAVDKTYAGAFTETSQIKKHGKCHKPTWHYLHKTIVGKCPGEEMFPPVPHTSKIIVLEITV